MKNKKILLSVFLIVPMLFLGTGCANEEVEPVPADLVIGTYTGTLYSEGTNGISQSYDLTNSAIKSQFSVSFDVAKKSPNTVTMIMTIVQKDSSGQSQNYTQTYDNVELKKLSTGEYEMLSDGLRNGQIGNGTLLLEESYDDVDDNGNPLKINIKITAKKDTV